jgi:hypothetical protein
VPRKHFDLLPPSTLEWFKVGARLLSLKRSWTLVSIDPEADKFRVLDESEWGEEHDFWVYELFWFTPIRDRFHRESVS